MERLFPSKAPVVDAGTIALAVRTRRNKPGRLTLGGSIKQSAQAVVRALPGFPSDRRYNLTISHERRFIWFRVAKSGTRSILHALKEADVRLDVEHASWLHYSIDAYRDYFKFAFVRNPWDRLVSSWFSKVHRRNYFEFSKAAWERIKADFGVFVGYVEALGVEGCDRHLRLQCNLIDLNHVDFVGRLERAAEDAAAVFDRLGLPQARLEQHNASQTRAPYQSYYDDALRDRVARLYDRDIRIFGYTFDGPVAPGANGDRMIESKPVEGTVRSSR